MKRLTTLLGIALLTLSFGLSACPDKDKPKETGPVVVAPTMTDTEALAASYASGNIRWTGDSSGKFTFDMPSACPQAPCPVARKSGTWQLKHGKLYLTLPAATQVWGYKVGHNPRTLTLSSPQGRSHTLHHAP